MESNGIADISNTSDEQQLSRDNAKIESLKREERDLVNAVHEQDSKVYELESFLQDSEGEIADVDEAVNLANDCVEERKSRLAELMASEIVAIEDKKTLEEEIEQLSFERTQRQTILRFMVKRVEELEVQLGLEHYRLDDLKTLAAAKKQERLEATRAADEQPHSLSLLYSRSCPICYTVNPRKRAVMTSCGHLTCVSCAEVLAEKEQQFRCAICQVETGFLRIFEDVKD